MAWLGRLTYAQPYYNALTASAALVSLMDTERTSPAGDLHSKLHRTAACMNENQ